MKVLDLKKTETNLTRERFQFQIPDQVCQMVCFPNKNPNLDEFWRFLQWTILLYFMAIWSIFRPFGIFYCTMVYFVVMWNVFTCFGILCHEKSGNPVDPDASIEASKCNDLICRTICQMASEKMIPA
jgi:hypothetical protein